MPQPARQRVFTVERPIERKKGRQPEIQLSIEGLGGEAVDALGQVHPVAVEPRQQVVAAVRAAHQRPARPGIRHHAAVQVAAEAVVVQAQGPVAPIQPHRRAGVAQAPRESRQQVVPQHGRPVDDHALLSEPGLHGLEQSFSNCGIV